MFQARAIGLWALLFTGPAAAESVSIELTPRGALKLQLLARDPNAAASLGGALVRSLGCTPAGVAVSAIGTASAYRAQCVGVFHRNGQVLDGQIKFGGFRQALIKSSSDVIDVDIGIPDAPYWRAAFPRGWDRVYRNGVIHRTATIEPRELPAHPIKVAVGYRAAELGMILAPAPMMVLLALSLIVFLNRRVAGKAASVDPRALWFAYVRSVAWGLTALFFLWAAIWASISGAFAGDAEVWALFSIWNGRSAPAGRIMGLFLYLLPSFFGALLCWLWVPKAFEGLRETRYGPIDGMRLFLFPALALILPACWTISAFGALAGFETRHAAMRLVTAMAAGLLCRFAIRHGRARRARLLPAGELSDRLQVLARQCGVKLGEVHVVPVGAAPLAEPLEIEENRVAISGYALDVLTPAEIEAEAARRWSLPFNSMPDLRRVLILFVSLIAGMAVSLALTFLLGIVLFFLHLHATTILARISLALAIGWALVIGGLINRWLTQRSIRRATALVGDPEALAGASRKLAVIFNWSAPPTIRSIATAPAVSCSPAALVFSSSWRSLVRNVQAEGTLLTLSIPPILIALATRAGIIPPTTRWYAYLAGMCLALMLHSTVSKVADCWAYRHLRKKLAAKMQIAGSENTIFVGLSPEPRALVYDGAFDWDVGFLTLSAGRLDYNGEQARFTLRRDQVTDLRIAPGAPHWSDPHWVYLSWRDGESGGEGTIPLILPRVESPWRLTKQVRGLHSRLSAWQRGDGQGAKAPARPALGLPSFPPVTAAPAPKQLPAMVATIALAGIFTSLLARFPVASEATVYFALVWTANALWDLAGHRLTPPPETAAT